MNEEITVTFGLPGVTSTVLISRVQNVSAASKHRLLTVPVAHGFETRPHSFIALPGPHGEVVRLG